MLDVTFIDDPAAAEVSLDPVRTRLLAALVQPASASTLAAKVGLVEAEGQLPPARARASNPGRRLGSADPSGPRAHRRSHRLPATQLHRAAHERRALLLLRAQRLRRAGRHEHPPVPRRSRRRRDRAHLAELVGHGTRLALRGSAIAGAGSVQPHRFTNPLTGSRTQSRQYRGEEGNQFKVNELVESEAQLLGRVTYEGFAASWPTMEGMGAFGEKMNNMPSTCSHRLWTPQAGTTPRSCAAISPRTWPGSSATWKV